MGMADRSCGLLRKVSGGSGTCVHNGSAMGIADSTVGANKGSAELHEVVQGLTFVCQNARGQAGEFEEEK